MKVSKTTINFAAKRGIFVEVVEADEYAPNGRLWFFFDEDGCEPDLAYIIGADGSASFSTGYSITNEVKEEIPATIFNEKQLRQVIDFIAANK